MCQIPTGSRRTKGNRGAAPPLGRDSRTLTGCDSTIQRSLRSFSGARPAVGRGRGDSRRVRELLHDSALCSGQCGREILEGEISPDRCVLTFDILIARPLYVRVKRLVLSLPWGTHAGRGGSGQPVSEKEKEASRRDSGAGPQALRPTSSMRSTAARARTRTSSGISIS